MGALRLRDDPAPRTPREGLDGPAPSEGLDGPVPRPL
ncbi:hypothetical protein LOK49_Contig231G00001 [Camellia lanceoleosa]|nr:hypothetical protein LOK49_Contig231G00001 [Camellia lanceoleosa]